MWWREAVARYHAQVVAQRPLPSRLLALVGTGDSGRSDVASNVKRELSEILTAKHGLRD